MVIVSAISRCFESVDVHMKKLKRWFRCRTLCQQLSLNVFVFKSVICVSIALCVFTPQHAAGQHRVFLLPSEGLHA